MAKKEKKCQRMKKEKRQGNKKISKNLKNLIN